MYAHLQNKLSSRTLEPKQNRQSHIENLGSMVKPKSNTKLKGIDHQYNDIEEHKLLFNKKAKFVNTNDKENNPANFISLQIRKLKEKSKI